MEAGSPILADNRGHYLVTWRHGASRLARPKALLETLYIALYGFPSRSPKDDLSSPERPQSLKGRDRQHLDRVPPGRQTVSHSGAPLAGDQRQGRVQNRAQGYLDRGSARTCTRGAWVDRWVAANTCAPGHSSRASAVAGATTQGLSEQREQGAIMNRVRPGRDRRAALPARTRNSMLC
jgi:hypothetical protein